MLFSKNSKKCIVTKVLVLELAILFNMCITAVMTYICCFYFTAIHNRFCTQKKFSIQNCERFQTCSRSEVGLVMKAVGIDVTRHISLSAILSHDEPVAFSSSSQISVRVH